MGASTTSYPWTQWSSVRQYLNKAWDPENAPHHSLVGLTRSGKSYLAINGILDLCEFDRVLIVDTKGDDPSTQVGKVIKKIPRNTWYEPFSSVEKRGAHEKWYRLIAPDNRTQAHEVVGEALSQCYDEGDWVIYIDECWEVTGTGTEGIGLEDVMNKIWRKGGYRHVSVVAATQTPVRVPRLFYDQAAFAWIGAIRDEERQKRLTEIGGISRKDLSVVSTLKKRQWLLAADDGDYFARTVVK